MAMIARTLVWNVTPDGCHEIVSHKASARGGYVKLGRRNKTVLAHRVVWEENNGRIPDGLCVLHHCDNPRCINVGHLFLGTIADNNHDMMAKGRHVKDGNARLSEDDVRSIRAIYVKGSQTHGAPALALQYGVGRETVRLVVMGYTWRSVLSEAGLCPA